MDPYAARQLPTEVLQLILENTENLSAASLVSRRFHELTFPLAHCTLELCHDRRAKGFIERVWAEEETTPFRISQALRNLIVWEKYIQYDYTRPFDEDLVAQFRDILPKLVNLGHLTWRDSKHPQDLDLFIDFQQYCPKLRSVDLDARPWRIHADNTNVQHSFSNLAHLTIVRWGDPADVPPSNTIPESLLNAIRFSPVLHTLILQLHMIPYFDVQDNLDVTCFFKTLGVTLPRLCHLEVRSTAQLEWNPVLDRAQGPNPIRSFFMGSSNIETLVIDWVPASPLSSPDLELIRDVFPALRHFTGPQPISALLLESPLRLQLESLDISSFKKSDLDVHAPIANASTEKFPQLRSLTFPAEIVGPGASEREEEYLYSDMIQRYLRAAPKLETLKIHSRGSPHQLS
ncbi:hypothetical protein FRC07_013459, partial [Ceratobasidium sp. 392]